MKPTSGTSVRLLRKYSLVGKNYPIIFTTNPSAITIKE
jgi:hypothetical protein